MHHGLLVLTACCALVACGGEREPHERCDGLSGNYDVALRARDDDEWSRFSLSLADYSQGCRAEITPRGYPRVSLEAELSERAVVLDDAAGPERPTISTGWYWGPHFFREFHFSRIEFARSADGSLSGGAEADVEITWAEDDICDVTSSAFHGTIGPDVTAPSLRAGGASVRAPGRPTTECFSPTGGDARPGLPESILPWESLVVEASEPISGLGSKLDATLECRSLGLVFEDAKLDEGVSAGDVWVRATLPDWDLVRGKTLQLDMHPVLVDAAGHRVSTRSLGAHVLDVGVALSAHELDDASTLASFGTVTADAGALRVEATCNSGLGGVAGRLATNGNATLYVRARVDAGTTLAIDTVGRSGSSRRVQESPNDLDWHDIAIPVPSDSEVGFSIVPSSMCHWTNAATLWIDRIWSE
jgi:hypothetical protein